MSMTVQNRHIVGRLVRNLVVTLAVTAIFALKATDPNAEPPVPDQMTLAAR
jgi:hypothetical protein